MLYYFVMVRYGEMVNMTEEQVTKKILEWLINNSWEIVTYDFPQSGTGKYLHPNKNIRKEKSKNDKAFIPDIVAVKDSIALFFENKNRFFLDDFIKLRDIKSDNIYSEDIDRLLNNHTITDIFYGIGAEKSEDFIQKSSAYLDYIDFIVVVDLDVEILLDRNEMFENKED